MNLWRRSWNISWSTSHHGWIHLDNSALSTAFSLPRDDVGLLVDASFEVMGQDEVLHPGGINLEVQNKQEDQEGARWSAGLACKCTAQRNNFSAFSWFAVTSSSSCRSVHLLIQTTNRAAHLYPACDTCLSLPVCLQG